MPKEEPVTGLELVAKENLPKQALTSFDPNPDTFNNFKTCLVLIKYVTFRIEKM